MSAEGRDDSFRELEEAYRGYAVFDQHYERIGRVDELFVDENARPEYIGVKMGLLGTGSTLIPMEIVRVNDVRKLVEIAELKARIEDAPSFGDDEEITPEHERRIRAYFGLEHEEESPERPGVDTEYGQRRESHGDPTAETLSGEPVRRPADRRPGTGSSRVYRREWPGDAPEQ